MMVSMTRRWKFFDRYRQISSKIFCKKLSINIDQRADQNLSHQQEIGLQEMIAMPVTIRKMLL